MKTTIYTLLLVLLPVMAAAQENVSQLPSYTNPVLGGDYPDPTIMREGGDYYLTHSAFEYQPGLIVMHSTDLLHWEPVSAALTKNLGSGWAPDICKVGDTYYIYFTEDNAGKFTNHVVYAKSPHGPWSEPVNLHVDGYIDPCHVFDETTGRRWLFVSGGRRVELSRDGLSATGKLEKVYDGWRLPGSWLVEGGAFEGPKLKKIGSWWYWLSAIGGTAGPATSHSIVVARSKSIDGPWENMPSNPLVHTESAAETWWSKGHGSLIDTPDGRLFVVYHAYEKHYQNRGRQMLMEPVEMTEDGWLRTIPDVDVSRPIAAPLPAASTSYDYARSLADFRIGLEWRTTDGYSPDRFTVNNGTVAFKGKGKTPGTSSPLLFVARDKDYEICAKFEIEGGAEAGFVFYYNKDYFAGYGCSPQSSNFWRRGQRRGNGSHRRGNTIWMRVVCRDNIVAAYLSDNGKNWKMQRIGMEISGYHHNMLGGFLSLLPGIYCYGEGSVKVSDFQYNGKIH